MVLIWTLPLDGAVHDHHTDLPPVKPAWFGSPASLVAPTFVPVAVTVAPLTTIAFAKLSLLSYSTMNGNVTLPESFHVPP